MSGLAFPKPSRGARLRTKKAAKEHEARELAALYRSVYARDGYHCVACHKAVTVGSLNELARAHPHHIIPRSLAAKAKKHTTANVCTVCPFCHGDIGDKALFIEGNADTKLRIWRERRA